MFSEDQLEQLRSFPEISRDELTRYFTPAAGDVAFVDPGRGRGAPDRLGMLVQLCTLPWLGFVPDEVRSAPSAAVARLADRLGVDPAALSLYGQRWRMLYETAARASEILALNVEDLDLEERRAPVRSKGGDTEFVYWDTGTAHLLPRMLRLPDGSSRTSGPLFLASRRPVPARRPAPHDICPHTGRARLGYDRARVLLKKYTVTVGGDGLELHQLRHSAATHLGDQKVPLQLIMAKTRHKSPRTAMRYVRPGEAAVAEVTSLLGPPPRSH
jgi:integrase